MTLILAFLATVAYVPGIPGAAVTGRWAVLALAVPLLFPAMVRVTVGHLALLLFVLGSALSLAWSPAIFAAVPALVYLLVFAGLFCVGSELPSLRPVYAGAALGLVPSSLVAISQHWFGWSGVLQYGCVPASFCTVPAGLFFNPNFMAELAVLVCAGLIAERMWWGLPLIAPAMLLPGARGALLALGFALLVWTGRRWVMALGALGLALAVAVAIQSGFRVQSVAERFALWRDTLDGLTVFGSGIGSFYTLYPSFATRTDTLFARSDHVHNDGLELIFEAGLGAALFAVVVLCAFRYGRDLGARLVFTGFCVIAAFGFPLHLPATVLLGALAAGHLCADGPRMGVVLDWRRSLAGVWRSVRSVCAHRVWGTAVSVRPSRS